jgi:transmembrane sensor
MHFNSIDDLVASESFRKWIIEKDEQEAIFWSAWIEQNPVHIEWVATARAMIMDLTQQQVAPLSEEEINTAANIIQQRIADLNSTTTDTEHAAGYPGVREERHIKGIPLLRRLRPALAIAASLLVVWVGYYIFQNRTGRAGSDNAYEQFLLETKNKSFEYNNSSDSAQHIVLSDGSEVILEKNSQLNYAANFTSGKREVYLTGNAFFNIARDPAHPFIVYTQNIVTKVLGTSFWVKARANGQTASVLVKTGKVSVFKRENFTHSDAVSGALKGLVLTPNQEMVYDVANAQMSKSLAATPVITKDTITTFNFDDTPASEVFKRLQEAYGITILLDEEVVRSCSISASLGNEAFYEKLRIICKIINATYQVIDGNVVINAKGCR